MDKRFTHTAPGPFAGYLFQPDRALVILCSCSNNESVAIEAVDDVAVVKDNGIISYREQDKHSIVEAGNPFADRSKDLWNTLLIWIRDVHSGKLQLATTRLVCVTNKTVADNSLIRHLDSAFGEEEVNSTVDLLKAAAIDPPLGIADTINFVLKDEKTLRALIGRVSLLDDNRFEERNEQIANSLGLNDDIRDEVISDLRGWFNESVLLQLEKGLAPVIRKTDLNRRLLRTLQNVGDKRITVLAKRYVNVKLTDSDIEGAKEKNFVKQLELIDHSQKQAIIVDAIVDFFYSEDQRTRLTLQGDITGRELLAMDDLCLERWTESFRRKMARVDLGMTDTQLSQLAFDIYDSTVSGFVVKLRGNDTEPYFTKGSFHKLSDSLEIGWHPNWERHFKNSG